MTDQVNPTGSLAPILTSALMAAITPRTTPSKSSPVKSGDSPDTHQPDNRPTAEPAQAPEAVAAILNRHLQVVDTQLKFQVDESTGRTFFQVVNEDTGEVVLQVPSEEALAMARNLRAIDERLGISGLLMNKEG